MYDTRMQDFLVDQPYPDKLVPPSIMNYAQSLYDILDCISCDFSGDTVVLQYRNNWNLVKLWHCSLHMKWQQLIVSNFYTANLSGIDESFKSRTSASDDIHILQSPIKYIWKVIFAKILEVCHNNGSTSIQLTPLKDTNSSLFYHKMITYYPDDIKSISYDEQWDIIFSLKKSS